MMVMDNDKIQELLLQLVQDMSYLKAKFDNIDEQKIGARLDNVEAQNREHDKTIKSLEHRADAMEAFTRGQMSDAKKQQTSVFISMGMAVFSTMVSLIVGLLF